MRSRLALLCGLVVTLGLAGPTGAPTEATAATSAADSFLARYVTSDGRVLRHDQGGDIVSEGQAYGMLIAELAGRPALARTIWSWTRSHLAQRDGLFAWHATGNGQVEDPESATDADVLLAYALLSYRGPSQSSLRGDGRRVADAVLANETVELSSGAPLPVAGPWGKATSAPTVDPSYLMPGVFSAIAHLTGDGRWQKAATASVTLVSRLTDGGRLLPPDWAQLVDGRLVPAANPGGGAPVQYGLDAARIPLFFAYSCDRTAEALAARWWRNVLSSDDRAFRLALTLEGGTLNAETNPLPILAGAAAASAAGSHQSAEDLRASAAAQAASTPTYYGDAWLALADALLDGSWKTCKEVPNG